MQTRVMNALAASALLGEPVRDPSGERIGSIRDCMLDLESGSVTYAVVSFDRFSDLDGELFAVPWSELRVDTDEGYVVVDVTRAGLDRAPAFAEADWPTGADHESFKRAVYAFWGLP